MASMPCSLTCVPVVKPEPERNSPWHPKALEKKIKLESTAGTGHFYTTSKNKKTMPEKMAIMKFDPKARKHVEYKEVKLK